MAGWLSDLIAAAAAACKSLIVSIMTTHRCFLNTVIALGFCVNRWELVMLLTGDEGAAAVSVCIFAGRGLLLC